MIWLVHFYLLSNCPAKYGTTWLIVCSQCTILYVPCRRSSHYNASGSRFIHVLLLFSSRVSELHVHMCSTSSTSLAAESLFKPVKNNGHFWLAEKRQWNLCGGVIHVPIQMILKVIFRTFLLCLQPSANHEWICQSIHKFIWATHESIWTLEF